MANYKELLKNINTFIFDYDGVLTDGTIITLDDGEAYRTTNVKDGYALQLARKKGYRIAVISGAKADCMIHRLKALQISDIYLGIENKLQTFTTYLQKNEIDSKSCQVYFSFRRGKGCVRDVIEQVLKVQGKWMNDDAYHW